MKGRECVLTQTLVARLVIDSAHFHLAAVASRGVMDPSPFGYAPFRNLLLFASVSLCSCLDDFQVQSSFADLRIGCDEGVS
jgi:hypothetical protein